jgi:predicted GIY-YIG superfamily endonuclease
MWKCYLLRCTTEGTSKTYVGATLDVDRRLEQHNGKLSGGARATAGLEWERVCYVEGFPHQRGALQFEWKWKYLSKKERGSPVERRIKALKKLLTADKSTSKADDYQEYVNSLTICWEAVPPEFAHLTENKIDKLTLE